MNAAADTPRKRWWPPAVIVTLAVAFAWLVTQQQLWESVLGGMFPGERAAIYPVPLAALTLQHLAIVGISSGLTILVGIPLGIWVTRASGRDFRDIVAAGVDFGQTFPPVAVLALMMPILGFGLRPAVVALFLYGLFPVVSNTVAGLEAVPATLKDAARGMGMGRARILLTLELPLAARVIMAGVRTSVIINIGTATVAAAVGAGGLGDPIIGGIQVQNLAYVFEGALVAAVLAVLADAALAQAETALAPRGV
ncbi:MAG: ABC transporter permease [Actinomycetota bacterium]|nr:ABC transporter permease [Actinomycetota bacterium]